MSTATKAKAPAATRAASRRPRTAREHIIPSAAASKELATALSVQSQMNIRMPEGHEYDPAFIYAVWHDDNSKHGLGSSSQYHRLMKAGYERVGDSPGMEDHFVVRIAKDKYAEAKKATTDAALKPVLGTKRDEEGFVIEETLRGTPISIEQAVSNLPETDDDIPEADAELLEEFEHMFGSDDSSDSEEDDS